ncbi:hypothetical protein ACIBBD_34000 [Streptomyces sp. NPDC051315]|uniref:hypothetical protein n=1 Tax=Streptomyces sp. NPDC051315 TaxID=3365650 RepID=UPI003788F74E
MPGKTLICATASAALLLCPAPAAASDADDLTARELAERAGDSLADAESARLRVADRGADATGSRTEPTGMDLFLDRDGNCVGTVEMGSNGGSLQIVKRGEEVWVKPDTAFWTSHLPGGQGEEVAELVKNRYVHASTRDAALEDTAGMCDLDSVQEELDSSGLSSDGASMTKGEETTLDGTEVIPLKGEEDGRPTTLYVTSDSPHRLVGAAQRVDGTDRRLTITDYDEPVPSQTPSADETVDIEKIEEKLLGG